MRQFTKHVRDWRWLPITACVLVFLFVFHAKTAAYSDGLKVKPHTATSSKLCMTSQKVLKPQVPPSFVAHSISFDFSDPIAGRVSLRIQLASGSAPVMSFSGLSPPLTLLETA